jgi:hypothetical protein
MSLNHIIQSSVPDDEALDVKFKDLELTGEIVQANGKLYQSYFMAGLIVRTERSAFSSRML